MAKRIEDQIQDEVRRRLTSIAAASGVDQGRVELEILWMLPTEFVRMYRDLFDRAFTEPIKPLMDGGKDQGRVMSRRQQGVGGAKNSKRWVNPGWIVRSDEALKVKRNLDRKLVRSVERSLSELRGRRLGMGAAGTARESMRAADPLSGSGATTKCSNCGQYMALSWVRCPFHT